MAITNVVLTTTGNAVVTSSGTSVVSVMYFCNNNGSAQTINVYAVPSGGSAAANTLIYKTVTIAAGDTFVVDMEKIVLGNGDAIVATASANSAITATASYVGA